MRGVSIFTTEEKARLCVPFASEKVWKKNHYIRIKNETIASFFVVWRFSFLHFSHPESMSSVAPISHANTIFIFCVFFVLALFLRCEVAISMAPSNIRDVVATK